MLKNAIKLPKNFFNIMDFLKLYQIIIKDKQKIKS